MGEAVFEGLNEAQVEAVNAVRGPVVILAGAGTGKTTTITRRIANQVATEAFAPGEILAVTFTAKAAREMRDRLARLGTGGVRANTFHAEALAQFRRFSDEQPEILGSKGQILNGIARALPMPHRFTALRDLATEIEWAKNRRIGARDYLDRLDGHEPPIPAELMHRVFVAYEKRKRAAGLIDFEDLLDQTVTMLGDDRALGIVRGRYRAFTVDEYQDVNALQQALLELWVGARDDLCVVGDDYQSIYGFTGAGARHLLRFADRYEHALVVTLTDNYRSTPEVLEVANRLVPRLGGTRKRLRATATAGPRPQIVEYADGDEEVAGIVRRCRELAEAGTPWEEMAVLFRINGRSEDFEEAFTAAAIPYQVKDGSFLHRPGAKAFLARARRATAADGVAAAVESIVAALGFDPQTKYEGGDEATRQADLERLLALARATTAPDMQSFVADLRARFSAEDDATGVHLMTLHRAKGLEFEAVFLPRVEEKELPFALATSDEDVAEERRLLYVGITRAKRWLHLSHSLSRPGERRSSPRPSRFLRELVPAEDPVAKRLAAAAQPKPARPALPMEAEQSPLVRALREWRRRAASAAGLPAYVIFHDATLAEIAQVRPATRAALRSVSGVGPLKMQRYGEAVLAIVANESEVVVTSAG
ncbi:MAG TPA: ATP-dependent DNA helicase UvrD2 [Actinomycetota bacterium]